MIDALVAGADDLSRQVDELGKMRIAEALAEADEQEALERERGPQCLEEFIAHEGEIIPDPEHDRFRRSIIAMQVDNFCRGAGYGVGELLAEFLPVLPGNGMQPGRL